MKTSYAIPGFSRYVVLVDPFRIVTRRTGYVHRGYFKAKRPHVKYALYDDSNRKVGIFVHRLAALAFHGLPPSGDHLPYHYGGDLTPKTVVWLPSREHKQRTLNKLTAWQCHSLVEQFYAHPLGGESAAREIGAHYGVCMETVYRYLRRARQRRVQFATAEIESAAYDQRD
jgi:hypothetical protein